MMSCQEWETVISAYLDGEASETETRDLFHHLGTCAGCRRTMSGMLQLRSSLIAAERRVPAEPQTKGRLSLSYGMAAAVVFVLFTAASLIAGLVVRNGVQERPVPAAYTSSRPLPAVLVIEQSTNIQYRN
ncbi:MAG: zf-HC2 domain-containing protein [Bacteroidetes bacterium]|nr:zf-HC2 domain-containing protein [Bacteroidota bacterium]